MRITYLSSQAGFYGGEVHLLQLARGLRARGHDVSCCVLPRSGLEPRLRAAGVAVETVPLVDWFEPVGMGRLRARLARRGGGILHTHCPRDHYMAALAVAGTRLVNVGSRHQLRPISAPLLKRPLFSRLAAMIAVSDAVRRSLVASRVMDPRRVVTVPNGADVERALPRRNGLRRAAGLDDVTPVVGFVGRLCPEKGLETLLEAVARLRAESGAAPRLFVVGDEPRPRRGYRGALRRRAAALGLAGTTHFFGWVEDAAAASADFDVHVVCSRAEPFGLATLEGMAHAHAVVATDAGGSPEIIRDGVDGLLVPAGDPDALARALARLLGDPELRGRLGGSARRRVAEVFPLPRMLDRVEEIYGRVLAGRLPGD